MCRGLVRSSLISVAIAVFVFLCLELLIRLFWPQFVETTLINGESLAVEDGLLGHRLRPNSHVIEKGPEYSVEYKINHIGLRDEAHHFAQRVSDVTRILLLGDSFTFGDGVNYEHIWPVVFENRLLENDHETDVVKAGVPGYDTWNEVLYLEQIFLRHNPDVVILAFLPNDLILNAPIGQAEPKQKQIEHVKKRSPLFGIIAKGSKFHSVYLAKRLLMASDYLYARFYLLTPWSENFKLPVNARVHRSIEVTKELLHRAKSYCDRKGARFLVLSIPQRFQVVMRAHEYDIGNINVDTDEWFGDFAVKQEIQWISTLDMLSENYRREREDLYFSQDGHLNEKGHLLVGNYLFSEFARKFPQNGTRVGTGL